MARKRLIHIQFPLAGLNRRAAHRQQPPYSTPDCLNVRAVDALDGRERGGSRPGLVESHVENLAAPLRLLAPMTLALGDGFTAFSDNFSGLSMAAAWMQAAWATAMPRILPSALASIDTSVSSAAAVLDAQPVDTSKTYTVEVFIVPWNGAFHGKYRLYLRLDGTTPDIAQDGVMVELVMDDATGDYSGVLRSVVAGTPTDYALTAGSLGAVRPGWLSVQVVADTLTVFWCGRTLLTQAVSAQAGSRVGFGLECTEEGGLCLANTFRLQYYATTGTSTLRSMLVASAGGKLYRETSYGRLAEVVSALTFRDGSLTAAQSGQKLYLADYGDLAASGADGQVNDTALSAAGIADWTTQGIDPQDMVVVVSNPQGSAVAGTYKIVAVSTDTVTLASPAGVGACAYRIERAPKVYDPLLGTIAILSASAGQVPTGCPLVCRYLDRLVLAGAEIAPHVWYMSRQGNPEDWDYAETDSQRAVAGTSSEAGVPGDPITALVPHSDDYLVIGCRGSLWRMRGDPAFGGSLDALSHTVGIIGPLAWCLGPAGELVFLSLDGIYALPPGGSTFPVALSRETLPREFLNLNPDALTVSLEYDVQGRGVHVYLTPESSNARVHWWMDWDRKTFWPLSLVADHEPTATCAVQATAIEESGVILGGRDGTLRRMSDLAENDCGSAYASYVFMGPVPLAADGAVGSMLAMDGVLAEGSGSVTWALKPSLTFEGIASAADSDSGTWSAGLNYTNHPACRGQAFALKIAGTPGRKWAVEQVTAHVKDAGRRRL